MRPNWSTRRFWIIALLIAAFPVGAAGWYLGSPLFINTTVNEVLPSLAVQAPGPAAPAAGIAPLSQPASAPQNASSTVMAVKQGMLRDGETFHKGSGKVALYRQPDGSHLVRLEDLNVTNGPNLFVMLSPNADPMTANEVDVPGFVEVAPLKGNLGSQNYVIPAGVDPGPLRSLVIFCKQFRVVFSVASLMGAG